MQLNPAERDPVKVADWLELEALYSKAKRFSLEALRSYIDTDGTLLEEGDEGEAVGLLPQELSESLVADADVEITRRKQIVDRAYPFEKASGMLRLRSNLRSYTPYIFCLLVSDRDFYFPGDKDTSRLFEHLTREAIVAYLGGEAVRFGEPRDTMPLGIRDAIDELARITKDKKVDVYPVNDTDKDLGLDVAGWKNFSDGYLSKIEVYMQCATGENWSKKKEDCKLAIWDKILTCYNDRLRGLAIPYVLTGGEEWEREACGLLFMDRLRIASVLSGKKLPDDEYKWWEWCEGRIKQGRKKS